MRHRARTDENHVLLSDALRAHGWSVLYTKTPTDALIVKPGRHVLLVEFKVDAKAKLTKLQLKVIEMGFPVCVIRTLDDVRRLSQP